MSVSGLLFMIAFIACLALALVKHPKYGIAAYLLAFYVHPPSRWWGPTIPGWRWSLIASAVALIAVWMHQRNPSQPSWIKTTPARLLIALTAWIWLQNLWALDPEEALSMSILYTKFIVLFYLIYRTSDSEAGIDLLFWMHIAGCLYLGTVAYGMPVEGRLDGVGGPGIDDSNILSMHLVTGALCGAMLLLAKRGPKIFFALLAMAFTLNTIVLCASRGAFIALISGCVVLAFMKPAAHKRRFYILAALGILAFGIVASASFWERMNSLKEAAAGDEQLDNSAEGRLVLIKAQWSMAALYPMGSGHRGTVALSPKFLDAKYLAAGPASSRARSSHNTAMTVLVEHGIPGAIIFVWLIVWCRKTIRRARQHAATMTITTAVQLAAIAAALLSALVAGMFVDAMLVEVQIWLLAMLTSIDGLLEQQARSAATKPRVASTA